VRAFSPGWTQAEQAMCGSIQFVGAPT